MDPNETQAVTPPEGTVQTQPTETNSHSMQPNTNVNSGAESKLEDLDKSELVEIIKKTRQEAASRRIENKQLDSELDEFRKWKESQMTELEKAQAEANRYRSELEQTWVNYFAEKYNVPENRVKFLKGTKEEIEELAKDLGEANSSNSAANNTTPGGSNSNAGQAGSNPITFPGTRGAPVGSSTSNPDELLRNQLFGSR